MILSHYVILDNVAIDHAAQPALAADAPQAARR